MPRIMDPDTTVVINASAVLVRCWLCAIVGVRTIKSLHYDVQLFENFLDLILLIHVSRSIGSPVLDLIVWAGVSLVWGGNVGIGDDKPFSRQCWGPGWGEICLDGWWASRVEVLVVVSRIVVRYLNENIVRRKHDFFKCFPYLPGLCLGIRGCARLPPDLLDIFKNHLVGIVCPF